MNKEQKREYLQKLLVDVQKCRSIYYENWGTNDTIEKVAANLEPWLFGERCIILPLNKLLQSNIEPENNQINNFSFIAQRSNMLMAMKIKSNRRDPTTEEIFGTSLKKAGDN